MTPPTASTTAQQLPLLKGLAAALLVVWAVATGGVAIVLAFAAPGLLSTAGLGAGAALLGIVTGLGAVFAGAALTAVEPGFLVLGASLVRMVAALGAGLVVQSTSGFPGRPLWLSFLVILASVMAAEAVVVRRLLDRRPQESPRP